MAIYRGPGGSGDAVNDSSSETRLAVEARDAAIAAQAAAEAAQAAAETAETNAETAETNAETAETNAETAATNAASSASSASSSASSASSSASAAATSASNASTSASSASTSATNASNSASAAATSATAAQTAETNAETAQAAAEAARDAALSAYDNFDDRYLGPKSSDPTLDNDGNALIAGALYFNTATNVMKVYDGSAWVAAYVSAAGVLLVANNLSDLANAATARTNLGVAIGTNVQAWDADLDTWATKTAPSGTVVGTSDSQTLTNKTISADNNTLSGIAASSFVLSNSSGNIDGSAAQKAIPSGVVVGTTDTQTLTNKTISGSSNTLSNIANSSLTNSSITINGSAISLGGSTSVGTVTGVTATSPVSSSGGTAPVISLSSGYGDTQNPYASKTAKFVLAAPNAADGAPTFRALVASDIPTLNQNTTGSAATLTTGRTIAITGDLTYTSDSFNGSANVTGTGTLATVNSNTGSFGSSSSIPVITVNGKGLITAVSTASVAASTPASVSDQNNTSTGYFDLPSGTTAQRPSSPTNGMIRFNTTKAVYEVYSESAGLWLTVSTSNTEPYTASYLVIAGGGGGGRGGASGAAANGGAGGAGGYLESTASLSPGTSYTVTVGGGGTGGGVNTGGSNGNNSVFGSFATAIGGGGGASGSSGGLSGSSGGSGGGGSSNGGAGGSGTSGQGNAGGNGAGGGSNDSGGGGGAGAAGSGLTGGNGLASSITGSSVTRAGGGGGGRYNSTGGSGGSGGGGAGGTNAGAAGNGTANTGSGGGAAGMDASGNTGTAGNGATGVVILSIPTTRYTGITTGSPSVSTSGANTILTFNTSGSYTA